jgi:hypothetical protein
LYSFFHLVSGFFEESLGNSAEGKGMLRKMIMPDIVEEIERPLAENCTCSEVAQRLRFQPTIIAPATMADF